MLNKEIFQEHAMALYDFCEYPAVRYKILFSLLDGTDPEGAFEKNERANPWQTALVCRLLEDISPYSEESNDTYNRYLENVVSWLMENVGGNGLWDWGPQVKDPWGYFGYFSCNRHYSHNRVVDCTMELLSFLKKYMENQEL